MRPLRLVLLLLAFIVLPFIVTFLSLLSSHPRSGAISTSNSKSGSGRLRALFSFHTPSSLWPPSAIISLTDDNSTFFLARPAAFGPLLPSKGLSGRLWVGRGFGDDTRRGDPASGAEGELGCSDVPGWEEGDKKHGDGQSNGGTKRKGLAHSQPGNEAVKSKDGKRRRSVPDGNSGALKKSTEPVPTEEDGTDDHLHHPLPGSDLPKPNKPGQSADNDRNADKSKPPTHADIQSLQESAEISGKVVLLSRGGCGFLEKVKWAQRRGAIGLIVGDDTRGGGLVTMYARGDTSNVTIPSLFTSHTTAQLLSSLVPPDEITDDGSSDDSKDSNKDGANSKGSSTNNGRGKKVPGPTFTAVITTATGRAGTQDFSQMTASFKHKHKRGWFRSILSSIGIVSDHTSSNLPEDSRRPPSSGNIDWVLVEDFTDDENAPGDKKNPGKDVSKDNDGGIGQGEAEDSKNEDQSGDGFQIGVQDWRDPDLVGSNPEQDPQNGRVKAESTELSTAEKSGQNADTQNPGENDALQGGSITPGSGEYGHSDENLGSNAENDRSKTDIDQQTGQIGDGDRSWLGRLKWSENNGVEQPDTSKLGESKPAPAGDKPAESQDNGKASNEEGEHDGLWVTMTPTSMSSSPFLDTLLVLVVSPLITLTVVYALLLLRSRIRRRRWRAPKSVVDRLPVRTYHTMSCSSTASSSELATPTSSSPNSPLLRSAPRSISSRPRPRSQTTSGVVSPSDQPVPACNSAIGPNSSSQEKHSAAHAWRRKYNGRQVECVVCLEEYVDGQSRVMSLPCGHEFHAECITPWLTTRRRTCPICKGDVVRSMNHGSSSRNQRTDIDSDGEEDIQAQAALSRNESPSSTIPIPTRILEEDESDLEHGGQEEESTPLIHDPSSPPTRSSWRNLASFGLSALSGEAGRRQAQADRNR